MLFGRRVKEESAVSPDVARYLKDSLKAVNLKADIETQEKILAYVNLMIKWNRAYNLTSVRDPKQIIARHIMDSLSILPYIEGEQIIDIGSGAGLPGIPLALMLPYSDFILLDSNGKKTRFLTQVVRDLGIDNISVANERVEDFRPGYRFDVVMCRAFSSIRDMLLLGKHLCAKEGVFLAMKGIYPAAEMTNLPDGFKLVGVHELQVPGVEGERTLVRLTPVVKTEAAIMAH